MSDRLGDDAGEIDPSVAFTAELTERGYRRVLIHLAALKLRFVPPVLAFVGVYAYGVGGRVEAAGFFLAALALPISVWGYLSWVSGSPRSQVLYTAVSYVFGPLGITYASSAGDGEIDWARITRWREAVGHILLYVSRASYILVPTEEVEDAVLERVRTQLTERVGPSGRSRRMR